MTLPVISLHQPWASLCLPLAPGEKAIKYIETRSWKPSAALIGERLGIASTKRIPDATAGGWSPDLRGLAYALGVMAEDLFRRSQELTERADALSTSQDKSASE